LSSSSFASFFSSSSSSMESHRQDFQLHLHFLLDEGLRSPFIPLTQLFEFLESMELVKILIEALLAPFQNILMLV